MKKNLLFCVACILFTTTVMANGSPVSKNIDPLKKSSFTVSADKEETDPGEKRRRTLSGNEDTRRTFHLTKVTNEESKVFVMIGKKPNTKVRIKVYDKNGSLIYTDSIKAGRDFATVLNLEKIEGPVVNISDNSGNEKSYTL